MEGFVLSTSTSGSNIWHMSVCVQCGTKAGTCRNGLLLNAWMEDHRRTCAIAPGTPKPCNRPGCLACEG
jgi:hypothetical protein